MRQVDEGSVRERGSASILALGIIVAMIVVASALVPLYRGLGVRAANESAADSSALAAADVASGISPGEPCAIAAEVASANRSRLDGCDVDGLVVTIRAKATFLGLTLVATATAGPPDQGTN